MTTTQMFGTAVLYVALTFTLITGLMTIIRQYLRVSWELLFRIGVLLSAYLVVALVVALLVHLVVTQ